MEVQKHKETKIFEFIAVWPSHPNSSLISFRFYFVFLFVISLSFFIFLSHSCVFIFVRSSLFSVFHGFQFVFLFFSSYASHAHSLPHEIIVKVIFASHFMSLTQVFCMIRWCDIENRNACKWRKTKKSLFNFRVRLMVQNATATVAMNSLFIYASADTVDCFPSLPLLILGIRAGRNGHFVQPNDVNVYKSQL